MQDLKPIIAKNITALRQEQKMTQIELAEKLNYSDKAVSKWERGESIPDVMVLKTIADLFGVTLDYLLEEEHQQKQVLQEEPVEEVKTEKPAVSPMRSHTVVTLLSELIVWFLATVGYVVVDMIWPRHMAEWLPFIYAVPVSMIVWLVFNSIWFNPRRNYWIISLLIWSLLLSVALTVLVFGATAWQLLFLGIPGQIAILIWSRYNVRRGQ